MHIVRVITKVSESQTYAQNIYLLKICLNLFEMSNRVLKFEKFFQIALVESEESYSD